MNQAPPAMWNAIQPRNQATKRTIDTSKNHEKNMGVSPSGSSGSIRHRRDWFVTAGDMLLGRPGAAACC